MIDTSREDSLGLRLKTWRKHLKMRQMAFADLVQVHVGMIRKYEANYTVPGGEILLEFAKTGLNINWLLLGEGEMSVIKETAAADESISQMLNGLDKIKRESLLNEFKSRVQDAKQLVELAAALKSLGPKPDSTDFGCVRKLCGDPSHSGRDEVNRFDPASAGIFP